MKTFGSKFALVGILTLLGLAMFTQKGIKPGIDLSGGTILVYQVQGKTDPNAANRGGAGANAKDKDAAAAGAESTTIDLDGLISALKRRINPDGVRDVTIRGTGADRIEIVMPNAARDEVEEIKRLITDQGALEFRILANRRRHSSVISRLESIKDETRLPEAPANFLWAKIGEEVEGKNPKFTDLTITDPSQNWTRNAFAGRTEIVLKGKTRPDSATEETVRRAILKNTATSITLKEPHGLKEITSYSISYNPSSIRPSPTPDSMSPYVRVVRERPGHSVYWVLAEKDPESKTVSGKYLSSVRKEQDENFRNAVGFVFNRTGARLFGNLTREHKPEEGGKFQYYLAIILDSVVMSAPVINDVIKERGIITGGQNGFTDVEIRYLIDILRAGTLTATLDPTPLFEESIGPTLGEDTIAKGMRAIFIAMILVPIFMVIYYGAAGVVSVIALLLNMLLLLGTMAQLEATFTLPGLAGLALTIGMAVDANILIFERIREEKERGAGLIQQVRNGFGRAWNTIFDANVTTILSGIVLYFVGTEEVKGFSVTLIIGLVWNLFTAVFVSRLLIEAMVQQRRLREFKFRSLFRKTNIDFIAIRRRCLSVSLVLIVTGLIAVGLLDRGRGLLNIDFTGGSLVTIKLKDPNANLTTLNSADRELVQEFNALTPIQRVEFVREKAKVLPNVTVESLNLGVNSGFFGSLGLFGGSPAPAPVDNAVVNVDAKSTAKPDAEKTPESGKAELAGYRFNIRTTEANLAKVREMVIESFGPILDRVELNISPGTTIAAAPPAAEGAPAAPAVRFAGGTEYRLDLNIAQPPSRIGDIFARILKGELTVDGKPEKAAVDAAESHFEIVRAGDSDAPPDAPATALILRTDLDKSVVDAKLAVLKAVAPKDPSTLFQRQTNFGSAVAGEIQQQAIVAIVLSWVIMAVYLWFRFQSTVYGLAAVIALIHDVLVTLGFVAFTHWLTYVPVIRELFQIEPLKIDLPMVAAFLTLIGFSVNDTIVVFDRIRELKGKSPAITEDLINRSVNQTLSRTVLTSFTAFLVAAIMYFAGGEGIHGFSYCMMVGVIVGTYSSIYIAAPILLELIGKPKTPASALSKTPSLTKSKA